MYIDKLKKFFRLVYLKLWESIWFILDWGGINPRIIVSKNTILKLLKGKVECNNGKVFLGFTEVGIFDKKYEHCIWQNRGILEFEGSAHFG